MISNKTDQKMSIEILSFGSALMAPDLSFNDSNQIQHSSELLSDLTSDEWLQGFGSLQSYCDGIELDLYNEPEFSLEAMAKEVVPQCQTTVEDITDYLDSTAFLSPVSIEPNSPQRTDALNDNLEKQLDFDVEELNNTSAMSILEEILSSTHSSDSDESSDHCFDDLNIQCVTEVSKDQMIDKTSVEAKRSSKRQQLKRKSDETDNRLAQPKANKKSRSSPIEKRERKRNQNKSAANRYRLKKRAEMDSIDGQMDKYLARNESLRAQLQKLQMEFKVLFPLAKAAFASVPKKSLQLQMLDIRVLNHNLLE